MKAVILAGGLGSRLAEETSTRPKPMVEIGNRPILWHIMKIYSAYGIRDFIICCGYKGHLIKEYFSNYLLNTSDVTIDLRRNSVIWHRSQSEPWRVTLVDTGQTTMTGGRLKRVREHVAEETFCFTYGDGLADINMETLLAFHRNHGRAATVTAVQPPGRFGTFTLLDGDIDVNDFHEKATVHDTWTNGGFFILEPRVMEYIEGDDTVWEQGPMQQLAKDSELAAFRHENFWHPMDTLRDKQHLDRLWHSSDVPWKVW